MTPEDEIHEGAWGVGLATLAEPGDRVLDVFFPAPQLGEAPAEVGGPGSRELGAAEAAALGGRELAAAVGEDPRRGVRIAAVAVVLDDLAAAPTEPHDVYLRLHLLSHRIALRTASTSTASSACSTRSRGRPPAPSTRPPCPRCGCASWPSGSR